MIEFYPIKRKDIFTIGSTSEARASYYRDGSKVIMYLDNIWRDTQNFEDFIEGLNVIYLTELLCMHSKEEEFSHTLCSSNGKVRNDCLFLLGAKKALYSNYILSRND